MTARTRRRRCRCGSIETKSSVRPAEDPADEIVQVRCARCGLGRTEYVRRRDPDDATAPTVRRSPSEPRPSLRRPPDDAA